MKFVPAAVAKAAARSVLQLKKNSPTLMFVGGIAGVVTTTVLACKATLKLEEVMEETEKRLYLANEALQEVNIEYNDADYKRDERVIKVQTVLRATKLYAPAILVGVVSIGMLTGSHCQLKSRNAALTAAYAGLDRAYKQYRKRISEEYGEETEERLHYEAQMRSMSEKNKDGSPSKTKKKTPNDYSQYARFFDESCVDWQKDPEYNLLFLRCKQNYANDMLRARGHVFLNEVYDELGIPRTKAGQVVGWVLSKDGDNFVDFGIFEQESERTRAFVNGNERSILLDFNVDGVIHDKI